MRACVQRVSRASVSVDNKIVGEIGRGLVVLLGIADGDTARDVSYLAEKLSQLRIFNDDDGKMNRSVLDVGGGMMVVSQFTLLGDCRKGRRPSFVRAAEPTVARRLYEEFVRHVASLRIPVATGEFQEMMTVSLENDGPVTVLVDSRREF